MATALSQTVSVVSNSWWRQAPRQVLLEAIDQSQWVFWRNQAWSANTNGGVTLSASNVISQMNALWVQLVRGRDYPDLIIMDNVMYRYYLQALQSIQRIGPEAVPGEVAEAGFQVLKYLNSDVVLDGGFQGFSTESAAAAGEFFNQCSRRCSFNHGLLHQQQVPALAAPFREGIWCRWTPIVFR